MWIGNKWLYYFIYVKEGWVRTLGWSIIFFGQGLFFFIVLELLRRGQVIIIFFFGLLGYFLQFFWFLDLHLLDGLAEVCFRLAGLRISQEADAYFSVGKDGSVSGTLEGDVGSLFLGDPCRVAQNIRTGFFFFFLHKIKKYLNFFFFFLFSRFLFNFRLLFSLWNKRRNSLSGARNF